MIIARAPFRVSFFGGGTDYPGWFSKHRGAVLGTTIDKYCWITLRYLPPFFKYTGRIVYSETEMFNDVSEIKHPVVREGLKFLGPMKGIELHHDGDLPAKTGLGSSSSFSVCFLHALHALHGRMPTKLQLTHEAIHLERDLLKENVGCQDQTLAAFGGFQRIDFDLDGGIRLTPVTLLAERLERLQAHLILLFTGFSRHASEAAAAQVRSLGEREREMKAIYGMVEQGLEILSGDGDLRAFGELLHDAWMIKRTLTDQISTPQIDRIYEQARAAGAIGGKLLGAGGGGFLLLFVRPGDQSRVLGALDDYLHVPFRFERQGSQIIHYEPF
jgi:D-glycero-alpha-D-manno-heptose-7-phosphate kinase